MAAAIPGDASRELVSALRRLVGRRHVLTGRSASEAYLTGYRTGAGEAVAVVRPGSLVELWRVYYLVKKGCDPAALKDYLLTGLDQRGARYPAEHNVGHLYQADPAWRSTSAPRSDQQHEPRNRQDQQERRIPVNRPENPTNIPMAKRWRA